MILLQNPNMPVPTNAVEIDAAILDIKGHLEAGLTWLTNGYGRTYKNLDATNGTTVFYPEVYLGVQNNSPRYFLSVARLKASLTDLNSKRLCVLK